MIAEVLNNLISRLALAHLRRGDLGAAFVRLPLEAPDLDIVPIAWEPMMFAVGPGHPLAGTDAPVSFADLAEHELVIPPASFNRWLREALVRPFVEQGLEIRIAWLASSHALSIPSLLKQASRGDCVVPVPRAAASKSENPVFRPSADQSYGLGSALAFVQSPPGAAVAALRSCVVERIRQESLSGSQFGWVGRPWRTPGWSPPVHLPPRAGLVSGWPASSVVALGGPAAGRQSSSAVRSPDRRLVRAGARFGNPGVFMAYRTVT